ncbi:MAG TPA: hypothetical protein DEQ06_08595 [Porphyromonadaceae bacterium]|nr:hypothetical protein [Porphyromonadaceae bacterium]
MFLARIKNPEQLKHISSNEFGKLLGIDRVPEVKRLRMRLSDISAQEKAEEWMQHLFQFWLENDQNEGFFFYIDGHVSVYHGKNAQLGKKHVSRQRLCLPGTSQFWINDSSGNPFLYVNAPVNEKLQEMIQKEIIPQIRQQMKNHLSPELLEEDADLPAFTLVFDREAYSPKFFESLWEERIAVITYRKNVKDQWAEDDFEEYKINTDDNPVAMKLCEKEVTLDGVKMREIRRLTESGHQTSVITTNKKLSLIFIAIYMFSRWCQENFFRYMRQEYDLDRIYQYAVEQLDENIEVVNPDHSKLTYQIKKLNEKISRRKAELYEIQQKNCQDDLDNTKKYEYKQAEIIEDLKALEISKEELITERKGQPYKIALKNMPDHKRYNQLKQERNQFINIIKMICYRAETTLSTLIPNDFKRIENEKRALIKSLIKRKGDIIPDYQNNTLTVKLYTMSTPRENKAIEQMCEILNDTETLFPGTNMKMIYKFATF